MLRERVHVHTDAEQNKDSALVAITLRDGRRLERHVAHNLGTPDNPMSDKQLEDKLLGLATPLLGSARAEQVAATCWNLLETPDVRAVAELTVP